MERRKSKPQHQASYWKPKRRGNRTYLGALDQDIEMLDSSSKAVPFKPLLLSVFRSPMLPLPHSPKILDNVQKELAAMEIKFAEVQDVAQTELLAGKEILAHDSSIIQVYQASSPGSIHETTIPEIPPH